MTRWARAKSSHQHQKQPHDPTPWAEFGIGRRVLPQKSRQKQAHNTVAKTFDLASKNASVDTGNDQEIIISDQETTNDQAMKQPQTPAGLGRYATGLAGTNTDLHRSRSMVARKQKKGKNINEISPSNTHLNLTGNMPSIGKIEARTSSLKQICLVSQLAEEPGAKISTRKSIEASNLTEISKEEEVKKRPKKKRNYLKHMKQSRSEKGILLLPAKVERKIYLLKKSMRKKSIPGSEICQAVRRLRRTEEMKYRKELKLVCFYCRKPGHGLSECPVAKKDTDHGDGICFRCGSTEHKVSKCPVPSKSSDEYPFAKCFVCKQRGHLSRQCPSNPLGLYPKGGTCRQCGSKEHLKRNCPDLNLIKKEAEEEVVVPRILGTESADADPLEGNSSKPMARQSKVVLF